MHAFGSRPLSVISCIKPSSCWHRVHSSSVLPHPHLYPAIQSAVAVYLRRQFEYLSEAGTRVVLVYVCNDSTRVLFVAVAEVPHDHKGTHSRQDFEYHLCRRLIRQECLVWGTSLCICLRNYVVWTEVETEYYSRKLHGTFDDAEDSGGTSLSNTTVNWYIFSFASMLQCLEYSLLFSNGTWCFF